jgi:hypothetical protein
LNLPDVPLSPGTSKAIAAVARSAASKVKAAAARSTDVEAPTTAATRYTATRTVFTRSNPAEQPKSLPLAGPKSPPVGNITTTTSTTTMPDSSSVLTSSASHTPRTDAPTTVAATAATAAQRKVNKLVNKQAARQIGTTRYRFSDSEMQQLLDLLEEQLPIGPDEWAEVVEIHNKNCGTLRDVQSIRRKFNKMVKEKTPTGDPSIPPQVLQAKHRLRL